MNIFFLNIFAKLISFLSRALGKGSGTSLPGLAIETKYPKMLAYLVKNFEEIILISGTNGKTTTRSLLVHIYESNGVSVCTNSGGANLIRGIASSLLANLNIFLKPDAVVGIFEVEEASLPILTKYIKANKLILTNVFRDQLDAYGEIEKTVDYFSQSLTNLGVKKHTANNELVKKSKKFNSTSALPRELRGFRLLINSEDPRLLELATGFDIEPIGFSLATLEKPKYEGDEQDVNLKYNLIAENIITKNLTTSFEVRVNNKIHKVISKLPGQYNVYNILAAFILGYDNFGDRVVESIEDFEPVFGRGEKISVGDSEIILFLVKNPAGLNEVLKLLEENYQDKVLNLAININDNIADGKDVSWLWDVDFEEFKHNQKLEKIYTSGSRGLDILLRLEYAGFEVKLENYKSSLSQLLDSMLTENTKFIVLSTYTATMELRNLISKKTKIRAITSKGN
ncbi:MAG: MurT ligase domain-containing protein [bacterium]